MLPFILELYKIYYKLNASFLLFISITNMCNYDLDTLKMVVKSDCFDLILNNFINSNN